MRRSKWMFPLMLLGAMPGPGFGAPAVQHPCDAPEAQWSTTINALSAAEKAKLAGHTAPLNHGCALGTLSFTGGQFICCVRVQGLNMGKPGACVWSDLEPSMMSFCRDRYKEMASKAATEAGRVSKLLSGAGPITKEDIEALAKFHAKYDGVTWKSGYVDNVLRQPSLPGVLKPAHTPVDSRVVTALKSQIMAADPGESKNNVAEYNDRVAKIKAAAEKAKEDPWLLARCKVPQPRANEDLGGGALLTETECRDKLVKAATQYPRPPTVGQTGTQTGGQTGTQTGGQTGGQAQQAQLPVISPNCLAWLRANRSDYARRCGNREAYFQGVNQNYCDGVVALCPN